MDEKVAFSILQPMSGISGKSNTLYLHCNEFLDHFMFPHTSVFGSHLVETKTLCWFLYLFVSWLLISLSFTAFC
jgi:hypothetical protein